MPRSRLGGSPPSSLRCRWSAWSAWLRSPHGFAPAVTPPPDPSPGPPEDEPALGSAADSPSAARPGSPEVWDFAQTTGRHPHLLSPIRPATHSPPGPRPRSSPIPSTARPPAPIPAPLDRSHPPSVLPSLPGMAPRRGSRQPAGQAARRTALAIGFCRGRLSVSLFQPNPSGRAASQAALTAFTDGRFCTVNTLSATGNPSGGSCSSCRHRVCRISNQENLFASAATGIRWQLAEHFQFLPAVAPGTPYFGRWTYTLG